MKKIILTIVAVLSMTTAVAENENVNNRMVINANYRSLGRALNLSADQIEDVKNIYSSFNEAVLSIDANNAESAKAIYKNAVDFNLRNMHSVLNKEQYRKYVVILNMTFNNRGLNK